MCLFSIIFSSSKKIEHFLRNNNNGIESILIVESKLTDSPVFMISPKKDTGLALSSLHEFLLTRFYD